MKCSVKGSMGTIIYHTNEPTWLPLELRQSSLYSYSRSMTPRVRIENVAFLLWIFVSSLIRRFALLRHILATYEDVLLFAFPPADMLLMVYLTIPLESIVKLGIPYAVLNILIIYKDHLILGFEALARMFAIGAKNAAFVAVVVGESCWLLEIPSADRSMEFEELMTR